jgi:cytochrome d ubiquinol oxidase subunit II
MPTLWFWITAVMVALYVVLDGFDLGAGAIHLIAARTDEERRKVIRSIGPVWDGNEVWLLAGGGVLYFSFPQLYASAFSGFYLPLMMVLWMLMGRAIALEFRTHIDAPVWKGFFDGVFSISSLLLTIFLGAALGNVIRGVPIGADKYFFLPLWTNWNVGPNPGILDWYTVLSGLCTCAALSLHGANWVALKTDGELQERTRKIASVLWPALLVLTILSAIATYSLHPNLLDNYKKYPITLLAPVLVFVCLFAIPVLRKKGNDLGTWYASSLYLVFMLVAGVWALFPVILPATDPSRNLTIWNSATSDYAMRIALRWWIVGITLSAGYFVYVYRRFAGKVNLADGDHGY